MKKIANTISIISIIGTLFFPFISAAAAPFNLGALNLQLANGQEEINISAKPGQSFFEKINISNQSNKKIDLQIYSADADVADKNYIPSNQNSELYDEGTWNNLPSKQLSLQPNQKTSYVFQIKTPSNAGVGEHHGAIMFKYRIAQENGNIFNFEKGIRVGVNIEGTPIAKYELINPSVKDSNNALTYNTIIYNSGNTDLKGEIVLTSQNQRPDSKTNVFITPGTEKSITLSVPRPEFGPQTLFSKIKLNNDLKTFILKEDFYLPGYLLPGLFFVAVLFVIALYLNKKRQYSSKEWTTSPIRKTLTVIFFALFATFSTFTITNLKTSLFTDLLFTPSKTGYLTTIKWGTPKPANIKVPTITFWEGSLKISSGRIVIVEKLHNEKNDRIYLDKNGDTLDFQNITGPDNDGVILLFKPSPEDLNPIITYSNNLTGEKLDIPLTDTINKTKTLPYKGAYLEISSHIAEDQITLKADNKPSTIDTSDLSTSTTEKPVIEIQSSPNIETIIGDLQSTGDTTIAPDTTPAPTEIPPTPQENTQLLKEISVLREIIQDLPASTDVLSQYILNSNYVDQVTTLNDSTTVEANPTLISKLKNAPNTIKEMAGSSDINFVFIPNNKVQLTPQIFSFKENKNSSQELGEIVFVQNKLSSWNTYLSISDFSSVSGKDNIPANKVIITPGPIKVISQTGDSAEIIAGERHEVNGNNDQTSLVTVIPHGQGETIFSLKPQISLQIPAGTPPGIYRAEISIKEI